MLKKNIEFEDLIHQIPITSRICMLLVLILKSFYIFAKKKKRFYQSSKNWHPCPDSINIKKYLLPLNAPHSISYALMNFNADTEKHYNT